MIVGGIAGGIVADIGHVATYVIGAANILMWVGFAGGGMTNLVRGIIASVVAFVVATVVTFLFGFTKEQLDTDRTAAAK